MRFPMIKMTCCRMAALVLVLSGAMRLAGQAAPATQPAARPAPTRGPHESSRENMELLESHLDTSGDEFKAMKIIVKKIEIRMLKEGDKPTEPVAPKTEK